MSEREAVEVLRKFMCCRAGEEFVDRELIRPFLHTLPYVPKSEVLEKLEDWDEQTLRKKEMRVAEVLDLASQSSKPDPTESRGGRPWIGMKPLSTR